MSAAAQRLGVTQSAVSHTLDKLRIALGDPLFVRAGRGIEPTLRAAALREPVRTLLDDLKGLTNERVFDPFLKNGALIAPQPSLMRKVQPDQISCAAMPFETDSLVFYMVWHKREHQDPAHQWLRQRIKSAVAQVVLAL